MIKMRDVYHADIYHGLNVIVYSTEPPEGAERLHFCFKKVKKIILVQDFR